MTEQEELQEQRKQIALLQAQVKRLTQALSYCGSTICDALDMGKMRYKEDFLLYSPWPELRTRLKEIQEAL